MTVVNCCPSKWKAVGKISLIFVFQPQSSIAQEQAQHQVCWDKQLFGPAMGDAACGSEMAHMLLVGTGGAVSPASLEPWPL